MFLFPPKLSRINICSERINALINGKDFKSSDVITVNPSFCTLNIKDGKPYGDNDFLSALISGDLNISINTYEKGSPRQKHTYKMLKAFREQFGKEIESGNGRTFGKRKYYIFKKVT